MSQYANLMQAMGGLATRELVSRLKTVTCLAEAEFRIFSQFGDDGIIQYLIRKCHIEVGERRFVEFGVENYLESNTRFLLINDNWSGLVMDSSQENVSFIMNDPICWQHDLQSLCAFISPNNINNLLEAHNFDSKIGLFSIDIDGMDYWIWHGLHIDRPVIMICEYNSLFGPSAKVTVPYMEGFDRRAAHHSMLYCGTSLNALVHLAAQKGYSFVGSNSAGNNAYFVRDDRLGDLPALTAEQGYVESKFRESRDAAGRLSLVGGAERVKLIGDMPVLDLDTMGIRPIRDVVTMQT